MGWIALACWVVLALCSGASGAAEARADVAAKPARILVVMAFPAPSHMIVFSALTRALAVRGHHVTLVTALDKTNKILPTHNHIIISVKNATVDAQKEKSAERFLTGDKGSVLENMRDFFNWGPGLVRNVLENPDFKAEVMKPGQKYDVIVTEAFFLQEAFIALGHRFNAPVVALNPFGPSQQTNEIMGNPVNPAWSPNPFLGFSDRLTFSERIVNTISLVGMHLAYNFLLLPKQQEIVSEYFPDAPPLPELMRSRLAVTLLNNHYSLSYPVPMAPGSVEVGGIHISDKPKPLPKDLKDLMDSAKEGVVYFSMGSNLKMEYMPKNKTDAIFKALGSLKEVVILKWDGPVPEGGPAKNIRIVKWAPQADILAHPSLRAFVTHGGLLSTQEAIYHGVPLVGIPVFADQNFNMGMATQKGFCERVDFQDLNLDKLSVALDKVLRDPKYKSAAIKLSQLFRSTPLRPADLAVFWVEHVALHGGTHLRPSNVELPLYQLVLLDVVIALALPVLLAILVVRALCRCCCRSKKDRAERPDIKKKKMN